MDIEIEIYFWSLYLGERWRRFWRSEEKPGTYSWYKLKLKQPIKALVYL